MGDSGRFEFTIKVDDNAADGKYYLPVSVKTDDDGVFLNQSCRWSSTAAA